LQSFYTISHFSTENHNKMLGGLLCERRHSEATPAMKPKLSMPPRHPPLADSCGTHPGSVPVSFLCPTSATSASIVLKSEPAATGDWDDDQPVEHTGKCIRIGAGKFEVTNIFFIFS
jgi:hypothetical protein